MHPDPVYRFENFVLDTARGILLRDGEELPLRRQSFDVLVHLVRNADRLVTREELLEAVWAGRVVTDASITQCLVDIRAALDDTQHEKIRTLTRRGYRFELPVRSESVTASNTETPSQATHTGGAARKHPFILWLAALAAVGVAFVAWLALGTSGETPTEAERASPPHGTTIAALPFENLTPGEQDEGFVTGFHDVLLTELGRHPDIRLIGRWSVEALGQDAAYPEIFREVLDADLVLTGSIARDRESVRFMFQLHDTATGEQTWAESYVEPLDASELIALQRAVARNVAREAGYAVTGKPPVATPGGPPTQATASLVAYQHYLSGLAYVRRVEFGDHQLDVVAAGRRELEAAISADPAWAQPYAALGRMLHFVASTNTMPNAWRESRRLIEKALELDPNNGPALTSLGYLEYRWGRDYEAAEAAYLKARALGDATADWGLAILYTTLGHMDESLALYRSAMASDPLNPSLRSQYARNLGCDGQYADAADHSAAVVDIIDDPYAHVRLAYFEIRAGRIEDGRARWDRFRVSAPELDGLVHLALGNREVALAELGRMAAIEPLPPIDAPLLAVELGQVDRALEWLEQRAIADPDSLRHLLCERSMRALEGRPRFDLVLVELGVR